MTLLTEIQALPAELRASRDTQAIADALSVGRTKPSTREIGNGTILEVLGLTAGNALLDAINNAPDFRHVKPLVQQGRLIVGGPLVAAALSGMVAGGVITQADADKLLAIAVQPDPVSEIDVRRAVWSDAGDYLA
jgi:hypothetical protein